ncbi:MAG: response regulator transcription factor [Chloroflexi bacterium]|nr:response regulator transcription factor [Chloroflexota bacterium]
MSTDPREDQPIRVLLVDDHAVLRAGLKALLNAEPDIEVIGEAADGVEAVERGEALRPDVIVMDIQMPRLSGLDATRALRAKNIDSKVLILTMHAESQYLLPLLEAGGSGYVLKSGADTELIEAIRTVYRGEVFLYPAATKLLVDGYLDRTTRDEVPYDGLTEREREVLSLVAAGYSGTEIAQRLVISPKTVDTYRERIMQKLGMRHRYELVRYALRKGMLKAEPEPEQA